MKTEKIIKALDLKLVAGVAPEEYSGVYVGDFLSRAMSRVGENNLWVTIMSNINVIAVASLTDCAAVILAEGLVLPADAEKAASERGVCVFSCKKTAYEICAAVYREEASDEPV